MATKKTLKIFRYCGPVMHYDEIVDYCYKAETQAISAKKALANLTYRWKNENGYWHSFKVELDTNCLKSSF